MDPFIGEIRLLPYQFAPQGWLPCDGRQLPINRNQALYAVLGSVYGGDQKTVFNLPNMQGFAPAAPNVNAVTAVSLALGKSTGAPSVTLSQSTFPTHSHGLNGIQTGTPANRVSNPTNNTQPGLVQLNGGTTTSTAVKIFTSQSAPNTSFAHKAIGPNSTAAALSHENRQPFLLLQFMIATEGLFPQNSS